MKKTSFFLALILFMSNLLSAHNWDILDKSMAAYNQDEGTATNRAWTVVQAGSAGSVIMQQPVYVNITKTNAGSTASWAWLRPAVAFPDLTTGMPYSIEVKVRVKPIGIADNSSNYEAGQISLRLGTVNTAARLYLRHGDGITGGSVSTSSGSTGAYRLNTADWQVFRIVLHADHTKYDVYVAGEENPVFEDISVTTTGDQNGIYIGAESSHRCNMDVEYVKMGTGDFFSTAKIVSVSLNYSSQVENLEKTLLVTAKTIHIAEGNKLHFSLIDSYGKVWVEETESIISNDSAVAGLVVPASLTSGNYFVKVSAPDGKIGNTPIGFKTAEYFICQSNKLPDWAFGGFVRPEGKNPVIVPDAGSVFFCPMNQADVKWEESDTFNPAAVVKDGKICVLYRAEDNSATGIGKRVSRVALAETTDGVTMTKRSAPVLYPDNDSFSKTYEWPGGCEDPRVAVTEEGMYVMYYTGWDRSKARLCVATSTDLITWTKYGAIFAQAYNGKYLDAWTKASSIVTELKADKQVVANMQVEYLGKTWPYFMYWGEARTYAAVSDDLINWTPLEDGNGNLLSLANTRRGYFDSSLVECGPPAVKTDKGIIMMYNGRNATNADADPRFNRGTYSAGQMLFDLNDPCKLLQRTNVPFFRPMEQFEKSGQYANGTVFIEGLVYYKKQWYLYYGCADSKVGVAIYDPANPADGDPIPDYPGGNGIAYYPAGGIGRKMACIHSYSGQTKESEGAFNLLYNYLTPRKWCEDTSENPWVIVELTNYYKIEKTVLRDVAPYESGNGNVPEYWIYASTSGTADGDWKVLVHRTNQQNTDVKETIFDIPEEARYVKFVATRGIRTDNGNAENAIRIYGFDIYGSFSREVERGNVVSVGKKVIGFNDAADYFCQPLHLLDGDATNKANRWQFNRAGQSDSLKYVIFDLESTVEIDKFTLYDSGSTEQNIDGYNIYVSTIAPDLNKISASEDKNPVWTKVVDTNGRKSENIKTDIINPVHARWVKLEIPRSRTFGTASLYEFEVYKKDNESGYTASPDSRIEIVPSILKRGGNFNLNGLTSGKLCIYNLQGVQLLEYEITDSHNAIPVEFPAGTYIVRATNNKWEKSTKLIVL